MVENRSFRICHVLWNGGFGGIETLCTTLCNEMSADYEVEVLFGKTAGEMQLPVRYEELKLRSGTDFSPETRKKARNHFDGFDIAHLHIYNPVLLKAAIESSASVVYTIHSLTHLRRRLNLKDRINHWINRKLMKRVDAVTTVSNFAAEEIQQHFKVRPTIVIPNCTNISAGESEHENETVRILSFGRFTSNKRFDRIVPVIKELKAKGVNVQCKVFGEGPRKEPFLQLVKENDLGNEIEVQPFTHNIKTELRHTDICFFPFHKESFGLSLLESISAGVPAFCYNDGGGMPEIIQDLEAEFIAEEGDMITKVLAFLNQTEEQKKQLTSRLLECSQQFSPKIVVNKYLSVYESISGGSKT